jgi:hypothetical protein
VTSYPTAKLISPKVLEHLQQHAAAPQPGQPVADLPTVDAIQAIVEAGFWASLRREEGQTPRLSLAFVSPQEVRYPLLFEHPVSLAPEPLTKVAPAVERPGIHLGVWQQAGGLRVWGATRSLPRNCFVLEVIAPGFLILKQAPAEESGKFINVAVLQGDNVKIVDEAAARVPDCPGLLTSLLGFDSQHSPEGSVNLLIQLAVSMRAHGRGGTLLVVPAGTDTWRESIVHPILYSVAPAFSVLTGLVQANQEKRSERRWQDALRRTVDVVAGLTAVDGATILSDRYELLAFGAKIVRRRGYHHITRVVVTEPTEESKPEVVEPAQLGGTRHLSAAQFEHDQRDAVALVASQDGRFTVFAWSPCEEMVHAHRIEALLL